MDLRSAVIAVTTLLLAVHVHPIHASWKVLDTTTPIKISDMTTTAVGDAIYMLGGCVGEQLYNAQFGFYECTQVGNNVHKFEPATGKWTMLAPMPRARYRHTALAFNGEKITVFGGRTAFDDVIQEVDEYDIRTNTWSLRGTWVNASSDLCSFSHSSNTRLGYIAGGYNTGYTALATTWQYDHSSAVFTPMADMKEARGDCACVVVPQTARGYIVGGFTHANNFDAPLKSTEEYDIFSDAWIERADLAAGRGDKAAVSLNGNVYVIGGEQGGTNLEQVEVYVPSNNSWVIQESISAPTFRFAGAALDGSLYVFGGQGSLVGQSNQAGSFYPLTDKIERFTPPSTALPSSSDDGLTTGAIIGVALAVIAILSIMVFAVWNYREQKSGFADLTHDTAPLAANGSQHQVIEMK